MQISTKYLTRDEARALAKAEAAEARARQKQKANRSIKSSSSSRSPRTPSNVCKGSGVGLSDSPTVGAMGTPIAAVRGGTTALILPSPAEEEVGRNMVVSSPGTCSTPTINTAAAAAARGPKNAPLASILKPSGPVSMAELPSTGAKETAESLGGVSPAVRRARLLLQSQQASPPHFSPSKANHQSDGDGGSGGGGDNGGVVGGGPGVYARHRSKASAYRDSPSASPARLAALPRHLAGAIAAATASPGGGPPASGARAVGMSPAKGYGGGGVMGSPGGAPAVGSPSKRCRLIQAASAGGGSPASMGTPRSARQRASGSTPSR